MSSSIQLCYNTIQFPSSALPCRKEGLDFTSGEGGPRKTVAELPKVWNSGKYDGLYIKLYCNHH